MSGPRPQPPDRHQGMVFPGEQDETWTLRPHRQALVLPPVLQVPAGPQHHQPARSATEIKKICAFWLQLGVAGFRMDAVPFIIEETEPGNPNSPKDFEFLTELRQHVQWRQGDAVLLAEANVEPDQLTHVLRRRAAARPTGSTCCSTSCSTGG